MKSNLLCPKKWVSLSLSREIILILVFPRKKRSFVLCLVVVRLLLLLLFFLGWRRRSGMFPLWAEMILSVLVSWMNLIKSRACSSLKTMICSCCSVCVFSGGIFGGGGNCIRRLWDLTLWGLLWNWSDYESFFVRPSSLDCFVVGVKQRLAWRAEGLSLIFTLCQNRGSMTRRLCPVCSHVVK